jgi:hypothetical protein
METTPLRDAYRALLDAASTVAAAETSPVPPADEWSQAALFEAAQTQNGAALGRPVAGAYLP